MILTGNETLYVDGQDSLGRPSGVTFQTTTGAIAMLAATSTIKAFDNSGASNATIYIGTATPGTAQSVAGWSIQFLSYDVNGVISGITWGGVVSGVPATNLVWNNRASYTYS
jgi:hypothetical protein